MLTLTGEIQHLLFEYDCVIIPELGGFVTNYRPARKDERKGMFYPPGKDLSFNRSLKKSDGLLANYLANRHQISFEEANEHIRNEVGAYLSLLHNGDRVVFQKVGILYIDKHQQFQFAPDEQVNYLKGAYGLRAFYAPQIAAHAREQEPRREARIIRLTPEIPAQEPVVPVSFPVRNWVTPMRIAAAAIVLPLLAWAGWMAYQYDTARDGHVHIAELNPFKSQETPLYVPSVAIPSATIEDAHIHAPAFPEDAAIVHWNFETGLVDEAGIPVRISPTKALKVDTTEKLAEPYHNFRYHIIGGCFSSERNATRYIQQLTREGYQPYLLDKDKGLYRVSMQGFNDRANAFQSLEQIQRTFHENAWIVRKDPS